MTPQEVMDEIAHRVLVYATLPILCLMLAFGLFCLACSARRKVQLRRSDWLDFDEPFVAVPAQLQLDDRGATEPQVRREFHGSLPVGEWVAPQ